MAARSRKHVKVLGYRIKRDAFFRALIAMTVFVTFVIVAWIVLLLVLQKRQEKTVTESLAKERAKEQSATPLPVITTPEPNALDVFCEEQRLAAGFPAPGLIKMSGEDTCPETKRAFTLWWTPKGLRLSYAGEPRKDLVTDGSHAWEVTEEEAKRIDGEPDGMYVLQLWRLFDPLRYLGDRGYAYRLLFDERFRNQDCRVVGLREQGVREVRFFFDEETLLEVRRLVWLVGQQEGQREILFDNYAVSGVVQLPRSITILSGNEMLHSLDITSADLQNHVPSGLYEAKFLQADEKAE